METNKETKDASLEALKEVSKETRIRLRDLAFLVQAGVLDIAKWKDQIALIEKIWFSRSILKRMLRYIPKSTRKYIFETCELSRVESYAYTRILNARTKGQTVKDIYRRLLTELRQFYGISNEKAKKIVLKQSKRVRGKLYYNRRKSSK